MIWIFLAVFLPGGAAAWAQEPTSYELAPVVVTSDLDKQDSPLVTAPGSFVKKDGEDLRKNAAESLEGSVGLEPNVDFGGGPRKTAQSPQIRGLGSERILILEDGARQNFQNGHNGRGLGDYSLIESLEVVKGPWSSLYGSGAMGGVFSLKRSTAHDFVLRSGKTLGAQASLEGATADEGFGQRVTAFAKKGKFEPLFSYHHLSSSDLRLGGDDTLSYSGLRSNDFYSSLAYVFDGSQRLTVKLDRYEEDSQTPLNPQGNTNDDTQLGNQKVTKTDVITDYVLRRSNYDFHAKPYVRETKISKARLSDGQTDVQKVKTTGIDAWNNLRFESAAGIKTVVTTGLEYFTDQNDGSRNGGTLDSFPDGRSEQWGLYLQPTFHFFEKLRLIPGVRYDAFKNSASGQKTNSGDKTSLKTYATYEYLPEKVFFLGWGQSYNAPRLQDIYISGQHYPGNFFVANPDLKPEAAETWEVGTKNWFHFSTGVLSLNATYFQTRAHDFISRHVDMGAGQTTFENLDRVKLHGAEVSGLWRTEFFGWGLSYGSVRSWNQTSGEPLEDTLPDRWMGKFEFHPSDVWTLGTEVVLSDKQQRVPSGVQTTGGYFVQDLFAAYSAKPYEIYFRVNNVYDREYRRHDSAINATGRDVRLTLSRFF